MTSDQPEQTENKIGIRPCPRCKKPVDWQLAQPEKPFCSKRCKLIDLGEWASESYTISAEISANDFPEEGY